jgi:ketosteroid isomerase-like protein
MKRLATTMVIAFPTPDAAEQAFYQAFAQLDPGAMRRVWSTAQPVTCIHPGGPLLQGLQAVLQSWSEIFAGSQPPRLAWERLSAVEAGDLAVHVTAEHIQSGDPDAGRGARVISTNVFRREAAGWLLIQHHASLPVMRQSRAQRSRSLH